MSILFPEYSNVLLHSTKDVLVEYTKTHKTPGFPPPEVMSSFLYGLYVREQTAPAVAKLFEERFIPHVYATWSKEEGDAYANYLDTVLPPINDIIEDRINKGTMSNGLGQNGSIAFLYAFFLTETPVDEVAGLYNKHILESPEWSELDFDAKLNELPNYEEAVKAAEETKAAHERQVEIEQTMRAIFENGGGSDVN